VTEVLATSLRTRRPAESLGIARGLGRAVGVVRVTDTTALDRLGVPVFAAIRPDAMPGSVCVSAGKGLRPEEAEIGAYMEAIELAHAEPARAAVATVVCTARDVLDARHRGVEALLDLCPTAGAELALDRQILAVPARDLDDRDEVLLPADLVLLPVERSFFGADSNGLSSGNSVLEATVHGVCEVIERDIHSQLLARDTSAPLAHDGLPPRIAAIAARTHARGVELTIRTVPSTFGLPFFFAVLREPGVVDGVHIGMGCHPWRELALARAVTEAFQSRLSLIHGGRDDLLAHLQKFAPLSPAARMRRFHDVVDGYAHGDRPPVRYDAIVDRATEATSLDATLALLTAELARIELTRIYRVVLTPPGCPMAVVRIVVPGLELPRNDRLGRRLRAWREAPAGGAAR
jgi:ribosomal protein S12 methylthiotransferase accessory factor